MVRRSNEALRRRPAWLVAALAGLLTFVAMTALLALGEGGSFLEAVWGGLVCGIGVTFILLLARLAASGARRG